MLFGDIFLHIGNICDLNSRETQIAGRLEELGAMKIRETWITGRREELGDVKSWET